MACADRSDGGGELPPFYQAVPFQLDPGQEAVAKGSSDLAGVGFALFLLALAGVVHFALSAWLEVDFMMKRSVGLGLRDPAQRRVLIRQALDVLLDGAMASRSA